MTDLIDEHPHWFVLNYITKSPWVTPKHHIDSFNKNGKRLELFAPVFRAAKIIDGKVVFKEKLLTIYYVFVRGTIYDIKELCAKPDNGLSMLIDRGTENSRYGIIPDAVMENFKNLARAFSNDIPFYNIQDIQLEEGDVIEVVEGKFAGVVGTYLPKSRSNKGDLVIAVTNSRGVIICNIDSKIIRILEFARDTRRQYDLLDSFIPKLFPILRKFHSQENLTDKEKSQLQVFNQRMGVVVPTNHKVEAKLLAVLMCVQFILGDMATLKETEKRFERRKTVLTNPWIIALIELILSVPLNDMSRLRETYEIIKNSSENLTQTKRQLLDEYKYYLE